MIQRALTVSLVLASLSPAWGQEGNGRFSMSPTAEGYLKLDSRTGDVTECRRSDQGYRCTLTPDERGALQAEIDRLSGENASLRQALAEKGIAPPAGGSGTTGGAMPSDRDFDRALTLMERFMRRFMAIARDDPAKPAPQP